MSEVDGWLAHWLAAGFDYETFWKLTPRQMADAMRAKSEARIAEHDEARARNHELAQLVAYAFHSPKAMPKYKPTRAKQKPKADDEAVRAFFIRLSQGAG